MILSRWVLLLVAAALMVATMPVVVSAASSTAGEVVGCAGQERSTFEVGVSGAGRPGPLAVQHAQETGSLEDFDQETRAVVKSTNDRCE